MRYLSVCSGIEAATQAWHPLGWQPVAFSEIDKFPSAVLAHHYPNVPNWGDMAKFKEWPDEQVDLLVGGTPCQSFSVAGLRAGLRDPRGNLALTFLAIAKKYHPRWLVWENVPGVLSADKGRAFGSIIGAMAELGYGWAYRVLDAQYVRTRRFSGAVPQRRRRVFVVAHLGNWRRAAAVLFDAESLSGNPAPGREKGEAASSGAEECFGIRSANTSSNGIGVQRGACHTLDQASPHIVAHTLKGEGDGSVSAQLTTGGGKPGQGQPCISTPMAVRRLTPVECERLQGFPDNFTRIPWRNKPADQCPDGSRYKALGNSMAVNVMSWIGERLDGIDRYTRRHTLGELPR